MRTFFDYTLYKLYVWHKWNNEHAQRIGVPWYTNILSDAIWGLCLIEAFIALGIVNVIIALFQWIELGPFLLYIWGIGFVMIYMYNEYYYGRNKKHKAVIRHFSKRKYSNIPVILFLAIGLASFILSVYLLNIYL